jgi:hypothetical protein
MKTKVINVTGEARHFGFLPPHGRDMAVDAELTLDGDLRSVIGSGMRRYGRGRELTALDEACEAGDICLVEVAESCCISSSSSA